MTGRTRSSRISKSDGHGSRYPPCENRAGWGTHSFVEPKEQGWATRRRPLLASPARRDLFLRTLERTRRQYLFTVVGYVIMPEHVHLAGGPGNSRIEMTRMGTHPAKTAQGGAPTAS